MAKHFEGNLYNMMKKIRFSGLTLRSRLMVLFLALIAISQGVTGLVSFYTSSHIVEKKVGEQIAQTLAQIDSHMQSVVENVERVSDLIFSSEIIQEELRKYKNENLRMYIDTSVTNQFLSDVARANEFIHSISIVGDNGKNLYYGSISAITKESILSMNWYKKVEKLDGKKLWLNTYKNDNIFLENDKNVLSNIRILKDFNKHERIGTLIINIRESVISGIYNNLNSDQKKEIFVMDLNGKIISSLDKSLIGNDIRSEPHIRRILNGENAFKQEINHRFYLVTCVPSKKMDWTIVCLTPYHYISGESARIRDVVFVVALVCLLFALVFEFIFSRSVLRPVESLGRLMEKASKGDLSVRAEINNTDEVSRLAVSFNHMISKIQSLIHEIYLEKIKKKEAEFKALQAQINPHFLYNTLESINSMAKIRKADDISTMVISLSKLLRLSINKGGEFISVRDELEQVRSYLTIQRVRYEDKFNVRMDVDEDILDYKMLKLILQPLVENAIYHGMELKEGGGSISISGKLVHDRLLFTIEDDGLGMEDSRLDEVRNALKDNNRTDYKIFGIYNVNERIKLYFGDSYGLEFQSIKGAGTTVKVVLPVIEGENGHV